MSPVSKWVLVCTSFFFAGGFFLAGIYAGDLSPRGPAPMYVIAAICGVAGILLLRVRSIPFEEGNEVVVAQRAAQSPQPGQHYRQQPVTASDPDDADVRDVDLTKISPAGCALCLSTVVVCLVGCGIVAVVAPAFLDEKSTKKLIGYFACGLAAAYFIAGRFVLKRLGFTFLRKRR
jgi:hypothetical protein